MKNAYASLECTLSGLSQLSRKDLIGQFQKAYGKAPPRWLATTMLALAVAYQLQEQAEGGLKPSARRQLLAGASAIYRPPSPGTLLIREWHGLQHTAIVHADHVEYAGTKFRSLTEVAFRITGQKRSGPAFFGLRSNANA